MVNFVKVCIFWLPKEKETFKPFLKFEFVHAIHMVCGKGVWSMQNDYCNTFSSFAIINLFLKFFKF
jgi:hypothetical protein